MKPAVWRVFFIHLSDDKQHHWRLLRARRMEAASFFKEALRVRSGLQNKTFRATKKRYSGQPDPVAGDAFG